MDCNFNCVDTNNATPCQMANKMIMCTKKRRGERKNENQTLKE